MRRAALGGAYAFMFVLPHRTETGGAVEGHCGLLHHRCSVAAPACGARSNVSKEKARTA
jgi:hypothetical protein